MRAIAFTDRCGKKRQGILVKCEYCEEEFPSRADQIRRYCSKRCAALGSRKFVVLVCDYCGEQFSRQSSLAGRSKHGLSFCSRKCKDTAQRVESGPEFDNMRPDRYKNGIRNYRRKALLHYGAACQVCGYDEYQEALIVHHVDRNRENNSAENLRVVCCNCHALIHFGKVDVG